MTYDQDTGEVLPTNGARASSYGAKAHLQSRMLAMNVGDAVLHDAIARAIGEMPLWIKADTQGARAKYATLKDILTIVRPPLMKFGVRIRQGAEMSRGADEGGGVKGRLIPVYTDLIHTPSGLVDRTIIDIPVVKLDPQAMGSAITYGRRYTLLAALGLASDEADDDGERAKQRDLNAKAQASSDLEALTEELKALKDMAALTKWASDGKNRRRIDDLTEAEAERLRIAYSDHREKLSGKE